ncbi:hypothetical protein QJS10_CPA06g00334 [Acorus calamus]|uniref:HMA domain-containing protein n=1 Tax=Acorus calamus TaxID=4465 RepID=A0AAV9CN71_ACOCL|nr:hypothetical protein QJS10_CPB18g01543 [Acorus calamus]KAK1315055.1 hypothetical protein QJS10_CPA06g00334 [Acorus calamus]
MVGLQQKVVVKLISMVDSKTKQKAIEAAADIYGIDSIAVDLKEQKMTIIGDMDTIAIAKKLRKIGHRKQISRHNLPFCVPCSCNEAIQDSGMRDGNPMLLIQAILLFLGECCGKNVVNILPFSSDGNQLLCCVIWENHFNSCGLMQASRRPSWEMRGISSHEKGHRYRKPKK